MGDYSRHIREASVAIDGLPEGVPPSGSVLGQLLLEALIFKRRRRRYREENGNSRSILGVSSMGAKYRPIWAPRGPQGNQEGARRALGGLRKGPSWGLGGSTPFLPWCPYWPIFSPHGGNPKYRSAIPVLLS